MLSKMEATWNATNFVLTHLELSVKSMTAMLSGRLYPAIVVQYYRRCLA